MVYYIIACLLAIALFTGKRELVREEDFRDEQDLESRLIARTAVLLDHLKRNHPDDPRTRRLERRWRRKIHEIPHSGGQAGKTIDKSIVYICLRDANGNLHDENTAFFVLIHELAHVCTPSVGHGPDFWNNMRFLLDNAIAAGSYEYEDYAIEPKSFCGQAISGNPYKCVINKQCKVA